MRRRSFDPRWLLLPVLLLLPVGSCEPISAPGSHRATILEVEYVNFAWVPSWRGFAIDTTGAIHSYDLEGKFWRPSDLDYPTVAELAAKYAMNPAEAGAVDQATFAAMSERAARAAAGPLSEPVYRCADAGTLTYGAWLHDAERGAYRRVLLRQEGDVARLNQSVDGQAVAEWLKSLQLLPGLDACQP